MTGRRAAATDFEHVALYVDRTETGHESQGPSIRCVLHLQGAIDWAWKGADPKGWTDPAFTLLSLTSSAGAGVKGILGLGWNSWVQTAKSQGAWEITEIAADESYGPALFDIAVVLAGEHGIIGDRNSRTTAFEKLLTGSRATGKYSLEKLTRGQVHGKHGRKANWTVDSVYRHKPEQATIWAERVETLRADHAEELAAIDWANLPWNTKKDALALRPDNLNVWLAHMLFVAFFGGRYVHRNYR